MNILLIHGLGRTPLSFSNLSIYLTQSGYQTECFGYFAMIEPYEQIVERLKNRLHQLSSLGPYGIVAHSLGGVLTRSALTVPEIAFPQHVVMLGTPNRLPRMALLAWKFFLFQWLTGTCGANAASAEFYARLPPLQSPYTIIAGTSGLNGPWSPFGTEVNDGIIALNETYIRDTDQPIELPGTHGCLMNHPMVQLAVLRTLRNCQPYDTF